MNTECVLLLDDDDARGVNCRNIRLPESFCRGLRSEIVDYHILFCLQYKSCCIRRHAVTLIKSFDHNCCFEVTIR